MIQNSTNQLNRSVAIFFLRTLLGLVFFWQGWQKCVVWGLEATYRTAFEPLLATTFLPKIVLIVVCVGTSIAELLGGIALCFGLWRNRALYLLAIVLLFVAFGHGEDAGIWSLDHVFPRAVLLATILLLPDEWDEWRLKVFLQRWRKLKWPF